MSNFPINLRRVFIAAGILILMFMVMDFNTRLENLNRLNDQREVVREQATQAMQTELAMRTAVAYATSDQAVEDWARSEGRYQKPGDQPVVPLGQPGSEPVISSTPTPIPTPKPNWLIWQELFFGEH
jgi:hypothetical protein